MKLKTKIFIASSENEVKNKEKVNFWRQHYSVLFLIWEKRGQNKN